MGTVLTTSPLPKERELQDDLNVIVFSDHGMTDISWIDKVIELDNYISLHDLQQVKGRGPIMSLWPAPGKHSEVRRVGGRPSRGGGGVCPGSLSFQGGNTGRPRGARTLETDDPPAPASPGDLCPAVHPPVSSLV